MKKIIDFENNLRLVYDKMPSIRSLSIGVFVNTGSINEDDDQKGISHFIEHMVFKGTKTRSAFQIAEEMEANGVNINAYTSKLITAYYTVSTDEHSEKCFDILSDILFNSTMTNENLDKERNVIIEEINMCEDDPEDLCFELLSLAQYGENNISSPILGYVDSVKGFNKEDCDRYMRDYYTSDNIIISVAGSFDEEKIVELVKKYFVKNFVNTKSIKAKEKVVKAKGKFLKKIKPIEQANVGIAFSSFPYGDSKHAAQTLITSLLGGGMSSRLFQKVREDLGIVYTIYTAVMQYRKNAHLCIFFATNPSTVELAATEIKKELQIFIKNGITESELRKGKEQLKSNLVLGVESSAAVMRLNGRSIFLEDECFNLDKRLEDINNITLEDANQVIRDIFEEKKASIGYIGKKTNKNLLEIFNEKG